MNSPYESARYYEGSRPVPCSDSGDTIITLWHEIRALLVLLQTSKSDIAEVLAVIHYDSSITDIKDGYSAEDVRQFLRYADKQRQGRLAEQSARLDKLQRGGV